MRSGARKIRAAFTSSGLTHFGGVYLFHRFLQQLQLRTYLSMSIPYPQRNNRYTLSEIILALIYPMILGLEKIEVSALLKTNGVFQYITGVSQFSRSNHSQAIFNPSLARTSGSFSENSQ